MVARLPLGGLIIGFGSIGKRHAGNILRLRPDIRLCILRKHNDFSLPEEFKDFKIVNSLDEALKEGIDFAVITSPSDTHFEYIVPLMRAAIPCYIEKPVITTFSQLDAVRDLLNEIPSIPVTTVGSNLRYMPSLKKMRQYISKGLPGRIVRADFSVGQWLPDWRPSQDYRQSYSAKPETGGGVILDLIHELDQVRWLLGEFDIIHAAGGKFSSLEISSEDTASILLSRKDGPPVVTVNLDYVSRKKKRRYEVIGEKGTLYWDLVSQHLYFIDSEKDSIIDVGGSAFDISDSYVNAMREFLDAIETGKRVDENNILDGLKSCELALRAKEVAGL